MKKYLRSSFLDDRIVFAWKRFVRGLVFAFLLPFCFSTSVYATYTASLSTSSTVTLDLTPLGDGVGIISEPITVTTNCQAGYNFSLSTTGDNKLHLDGDSSNNTTNVNIFNPIDTTYALSQSNNTNTWGIALSNNPNTAGTFLPLSTTPTVLKTAQETASESDINETFDIYYGAKASNTLSAGQYSMANDGKVVYYLTIDSSCVDSAEITFVANAGSDTVTNLPISSENTTDNTNHTITLSSKTPVRTGYIFKEWNTNASGTGSYYYPGQTVPIGQDGLAGFTELYAIWLAECAANTICYDGNHADDGVMVPQTDVTTNSVVLTSSNFSRADYGFAGWNTKPDGSGTNYGPIQTIDPGDLTSTGLTLFAHWLAPTGTLQTWAGASNMSVGDVIALRDNRDDEVYTVAKLVDNNVWIVENLRLVPGTANITNKNTNNPTADFLSSYKPSSSTTTQCSSSLETCLNKVYYYTGNMNRSATQLPTGNTSDNAWYSYGTMYNWYTATAGNGTADKASGDVAGDICPSGWHLPNGGINGEYKALATALGGTGSAGATNIRKYPNNFIWSGDYNPSTVIPDGRGTQARLWHGTASNSEKAYRMGYNSSGITPVNTYNKWDDFAVRCIYQGGNIHYADVEVDFLGSGITSLTFTNNNYATETATPSNPTVSLAENASYNVTATTSAGYEVASWTTTANGVLGNTTTTNPAPSINTYTISDEATLTVTGQEIPSYTVTVELGAHVSSVSFSHPDYPVQTVTNTNVGTNTNNGEDTGTVSLRRGITYTLSSSYESGYTVDTWTSTANGTLGSATSAATTYTISGAATLSLNAQETSELTYTLVYSAGAGTDAPGSETISSYNASESFTITNSAPIYYGYTFTGWSETPVDSSNCNSNTENSSCNGTSVDYTSGNTINVSTTGTSTTKTLYPVYTAVATCPANKICYYENGADVLNGGRGTMANQSTSSGASVNLVPTNYSKAGYGFAGWTTSTNATPYGPNANITAPDISSSGLSLYAKWVKSIGDLQTWNGCNGLNTNDVIALTDVRDGQTYAVAKLADDKCWIIENLRLVPSTANIQNDNTHNPASGFATAAANSSASTTLCGVDGDTTCNNQLQYNTNSLDRTLTQSYNTAGNNVAWYSYGVYYNWYTATAGNGTISTSANTNVAGDICPSKWHLPTGNSGEWANLNTAVNSGSTSPNLDAGLRAYPVNLLWSGDYNKTSRTNAQTNGRYWTATGLDSSNAYRVGFQGSSVTVNGNYRKWDAFAVRCIYDGDIANPHDVVVTLPTGVESITFSNNTYGSQTATSQNTTISLAENATYTITANLTTGYEFTSWVNGWNSIIANTSQNPTTIAIADDTTLTLTVQVIPTYTTTVNLDMNTNSVTFYNADYGTQTVTSSNVGTSSDTGTVTLRRGVPYTITASFSTGYSLSALSTDSNGTLGSTNSLPTTFTISNNSTLSITSHQRQGLDPSDCPANSICYAPNTSDTQGDMSSLGTTTALTTASSTAGKVSATPNSTTQLIAPNFYREGYGFAGWSTDFTATNSSTIYGPNETISTNPSNGGLDVSSGAILYPVWVASSGTLQEFSCASSSLTPATYNSTTGKVSATLSSITALTDARDGNTYAVAKLADGQCWMIENLRLNSEHTTSSENIALAEGYGNATTSINAVGNNLGRFIGLPASEDANFANNTTANSLYSKNGSNGTININSNSSYLPAYRLPRYNKNNTNMAPNATNSDGTTSLVNSYNANDNHSRWYGYGNYYNWPAAMANTEYYANYSGNNGSDAAGTSICPSNWHLPLGYKSTGELDNQEASSTWRVGGFSYLDRMMGGTGQDQNSTAGSTQSVKWRSFPNNFVYSGGWSGAQAYERISNGHYWSSSAYNAENAYYLRLNSSIVAPGSNSNYKSNGFTVRCVAGS